MPTDSSAPGGVADQQQQPQGRSWKQTIFQILLFQMVMRFFFPKPQQQARDPTTGDVIPPLQNAFTLGLDFDLYVYISPNASSTLQDFVGQPPLWFLPAETFAYNRKAKDRHPLIQPLTYTPDPAVYKTITAQYISNKKLQETIDQAKQQNLTASDKPYKPSLLDTMFKQSAIALKRRELMETWSSLYLMVYAVPHSAYEDINSLPTDGMEAGRILQQINFTSEASELIAKHAANLIEYTRPFKEKELQSLLGGNEELISSKDGGHEENNSADEAPHWKDHLDIRMLADAAPLTPQAVQTPPLKRYIQIAPEKGIYYPVLYASDLWLLERNYVALNETLYNQPLNLTLSFNILNSMWFTIQSQLNEVWSPDPSIKAANPLLALQGHSRRETFMVKRIVLDTNPYLLAFSAAFMLLHTLFSMLAFKNDIQFWRRNESMEGLSALSVVFSFVCEVVIALYLYDSEETSFLILFEIFMGLAISAWKVTKAINISWSWKSGILPQIAFSDKKDYEESLTKKYDRMAIKFMSILLLPCMSGYALYSLKYKKYKSWYSYIISTLAGTVYTFGFIMMTPQLYINYKLQSVDHLPWRAFTYKALNTFVDDVAAFIIDMPWMHRLACFRDDIIFVCYLYQRWVYSVDKTRPSEWVDPAEQEKIRREEEEKKRLINNESEQLQEGEELKDESEKESTELRQRRQGGQSTNNETDQVPEREQLEEEKEEEEPEFVKKTN